MIRLAKSGQISRLRIRVTELLWVVPLQDKSYGKRYIGHSFNSVQETDADDNSSGLGKMNLASNLACLVEESSSVYERKPKSRLELKRLFELRIKKRVKEQFRDGKYHDLMGKVIANAYTLRDAYDSIRVNSNVDLESQCDDIHFESLVEELSCENFNVSANTYSISTRGQNKEALVLPNLKLNVIQEAIRIALEVVYKPHYSKISHGCRSGRGHLSALKYIRKEILNADWWFNLAVNKKVDACVLAKLISTMEYKIEDPKFSAIIHSMFDAKVLNLEFGAFAKGHGLPQEGILSPILMNIYLDLFDCEFYKMTMKYEALDARHNGESDGSCSKLRSWFRRQMDRTTQSNDVKISGVRVYCCRFMDEILIVIRGSKGASLAIKSEIETYLRDSLHLEIDSQTDTLPCDYPQGVRFLGTMVRRRMRESPLVRAVHKLKDKVELFVLQKQEAWDEGTVRIGKKCLGHGLKKVKESEIEHLADSHSTLSQVSQFRKPGMKTDHWYKVLLKIWFQETNAKFSESEESILSRFIAEQALPRDLKDSFYAFQKHAKEYISSEAASTLSLLPEFSASSQSVTITEVVAPVNAIKMRLQRYGLTNSKGNPCACKLLISLDHDHIIDWFSGIVYRWLRWYHFCENFTEIKLIISDQVRKSCILTLATKYKIHESEIERKFDLDLSRLPSMDPSVEEIEHEMINEMLVSQATAYDEGLLYGIPYSGLCLLSLARTVSRSRPCTCFVMGCGSAAQCVYTIHVMERQKFPGWKTGFSSCIHPSIHGRRIGLCNQHLKDLYLSRISLQSIDFGAWK